MCVYLHKHLTWRATNSPTHPAMARGEGLWAEGNLSTQSAVEYVSVLFQSCMETKTPEKRLKTLPCLFPFERHRKWQSRFISAMKN